LPFPTLLAGISETNPFAISGLSSGYIHIVEATPNQEAMGKMKEGKCGDMMKTMDGWFE